MHAKRKVIHPRLIGAAVLLVFGNIVLSMPAGAATGDIHEIKLPPEGAALRPSELPGYTIALQKCGICHSADYINLQPPHMSLTQWTAEMTKMQHAYGAPIDETEIKLLGIYFTATYGDATSIKDADAAIPDARAAIAAGGGSTKIDHFIMMLGSLSNRLYETFSITGQLGLSDASDARKLLQRGGTLLGHLAQSRIVEDHVGGKPVLIGELFTQRTQHFEYRPVAVAE